MRASTRTRLLTSLAVVGGVGVLFAAGAVTWAQLGPPQLATPAKAETVRRPLPRIRVIDGDTVKIGAETVRLSNVDTPELPPGAECWAEARLAWEAKAHLEQLLDPENAVAVEVVRDPKGRDRYGRTLGRVVVNGTTDAGEDLMAWGRAVPWTGRRWDWCGRITDDPNGSGLVNDPRDTLVEAYGPGAEYFRP